MRKDKWDMRNAQIIYYSCVLANVTFIIWSKIKLKRLQLDIKVYVCKYKLL